MHDDAVEGLRVRELVIELGFADRAAVDHALEVQEDLHDQGVIVHLIDVLEDEGTITGGQREQVLLHQAMRMTLAELPDARRDHRPDRWVVAGVAPAALIGTPLGILAAAAVLAIGAWLAAGRPWRWVALGWLAAVAVPGTPVGAPAAAGVAGSAAGAPRDRSTHLVRAAAVAAALAPTPYLPVALTPAHYLVAAAVAVAILGRRA